MGAAGGRTRLRGRPGRAGLHPEFGPGVDAQPRGGAPMVRADSEESRRQIAEHIRRAAKAALAPAIYLLGVLTERGIGIKRDQAAAAVLFRRAASLGNRSGQASWGRALMWGLVS